MSVAQVAPSFVFVCFFTKGPIRTLTWSKPADSRNFEGMRFGSIPTLLTKTIKKTERITAVERRSLDTLDI